MAKKKTIRRINKVINTFSYMIFILGISLIISAFGIVVANDMFALIKEDSAMRFVFASEKTPDEVAEVLTENEVIKFGWAFKLFYSLKNAGNYPVTYNEKTGEEIKPGLITKLLYALNNPENFPAGTYDINTGMDYGQIISALTTKIRETTMITVPEGFNIRQIAELVEKEGVCTAKDFIETANTYKFSHTMLADVPMVENRLEGYLFPDTYEFYKDDQPVSVINKMLNNFVNKYTPEMKNLTANREMSINDIIIIASLIEREAKIATERTVISGVIYNRLNSPDKYPYLQIDATILYALPEHKGTLSEDELKLASPYNTYTNQGLPPTAICNPGISSILAAISPEKHSYYYYVVNDLEKGSHAFAKTEKEHANNVAAYRKLVENAK